MAEIQAHAQPRKEGAGAGWKPAACCVAPGALPIPLDFYPHAGSIRMQSEKRHMEKRPMHERSEHAESASNKILQKVLAYRRTDRVMDAGL